MLMLFRAALLFSAIGFAVLNPAQAQGQTSEQPTDPAFAESYAEAAKARARILENDFDGAEVYAAPLAAAGNPVAQNLMGIIIESGSRAGADKSGAIEMYELAGAQGYPKAYHNAALLYLEQDVVGVPFSPENAVVAYRAAAALGYAPSHEEWVWHLMWGDASVLDLEEAARQAQIGVEAYPDNARLKDLLADCYFFGKGTPVDDPAALALYEGSAALGSSYGQYSAGYQYFWGIGVAADYTLARDYFELAAQQDYGRSFGFLASIYFNGYGVTPDPTRALTYARSGDGRDDGRAAYYIGEVLRNGIGGETDYTQARAAYERSYEAGYVYALMRLGDMAYFAQGEPEDFTKAFGIFEQVWAVDSEEEDAAYSLGYMLMRGEGTEVDRPAALEYIEAAVALGHFKAIGEAILLFGGDEFVGDHSDKARAAAYCFHAEIEDFLASVDPSDAINATCRTVRSSLSDAERAQAKDILQGL